MSAISWTGEFNDPAEERAFIDASAPRVLASAKLCILATLATCLSFLPLDLLMLDGDRLVFFMGIRSAIVLMTLAALAAMARAADVRNLLRLAYAQQYVFFTLNALIFNHPALLRHGGIMMPLIAISLFICMPGGFRAAAALCAYAPAVSLLFWGVLRPQPEGVLDLLIVGFMAATAYVVGGIARIQLGRMRREEYLRNRILLGAKEEAEAGSRAKADFLAVMSHEIRTPINGVLGMVRLVLDGPLSARERRRLETACQSAEGLLTILDDILDITKLEAGRVEFESEPFPLPRTIGDVAALMTTQAREKGLRFDLELAPDLPDWVSGDSARLRQVLFNLIGNAVKFTETGGITVTATAEPAGPGLVRVGITVTDTGIGIDQSQRERLFQAFGQADASINRRFGGTGLGLVICKKLVEGMGGAIDFDSTPGQGSRFHVGLTLAAATMPQAIEETQSESVEPLSVLLAEDNPVNAEVAKVYLRKNGHRVVLATDGAQAVELARQGGFDLILMDMRMPRVDGLEATRRIRALPGPVGRVPIVALTANALKADVDRCMAAGMDAHLAKPMRQSALNETIARVLDGRVPAAPARGTCLDVLLPGGDRDGAEAKLRALGHRVFAVPRDDAALAMLKARPFDLVVISDATAERVAAFRATADAGNGKTRLLAVAAAPADPSADGRLRAAGAHGVMLSPTEADALAAAIDATIQGIADEQVEDVLGPERLAQLRHILIESLRDQVPLLSDPALPAAQLAAIAHRIKGSAANLGLDALAAAAGAAQAAAEAPTIADEAHRDAQHGLCAALRRVMLAATDPAPSQE